MNTNTHLRNNRKLANWVNQNNANFIHGFWYHNADYHNITVKPVHVFSRKRRVGIQFYENDEAISVCMLEHAIYKYSNQNALTKFPELEIE